MKYLFLACILFSLNALAEVPIHPLGSFEAVQSNDGEHCNGYSIDLLQKSETEMFGLMNHHAGLCGDPGCSLLTGSYKDGSITFSTTQPIYEKIYSFKGLINNNNQLTGQLNNVDISLKSNALGMKTETLNQWCSFWEQVPRCKGVREYCAQSLNRPLSGSPYKWKIIDNNCQISSDDVYNKKLEKFASLLFGKPSSTQMGCVTNPYLASEYSKYQPGIENHAGLDLKSNGNKVYAPYNGIVVLQDLDLTKEKSTLTIYSKYAGINTMLLHCNSHMGLKKGDIVKKGDVVCITGDVGASAPHLHVEVKAINMDAENLKAMSANRGVCKGSSFIKGFDPVTKNEVIEEGCSYYDVRENTFDPILILDLLKNEPQVNVSENSNKWLFKEQPDFELNIGYSKAGFSFSKNGEVSYEGQVLKENPKLAKQYLSGDDSIHIYYSPEKTKALLIYNTTVWGGIFASLVDLKNQKVLMREIVNSHGVGLNGVSWSALGEYLAFAYVSELDTQFALAILGTKALDLYKVKPLNNPEKAGFKPKQESINWRDNTTIEVDFDMSIVNYASTGEPALQKSYATTVLQKLSKDNNPWIVQDNPNYKLKPGEIKNNFKFNITGEVIFGGKVLFPKTKRIDKYTELKVYISPTNPSKALVAFRDWDYGVLRAAIVDLSKKTIISDQLIPDSSVRGSGNGNILTINDTAFSWSQNGQFLAMAISPSEFQLNLAAVNLSSGKINQYWPSKLSELKEQEAYSPDMQSIKWIGNKSLQFNFDYYIYKDNEGHVRDYSTTEVIANRDLPMSMPSKGIEASQSKSTTKNEHSQELVSIKKELLDKVNSLYLKLMQKAEGLLETLRNALEKDNTGDNKVQSNSLMDEIDWETPPRVTLKGLGPIKIGMSLDELKVLLNGKLNISGSVNSGYCFVGSPSSKSEDIEFMFDGQKRLSRIDISSSKYKSLSGAYVGQDQEHLINMYEGQLVKALSRYDPNTFSFTYVPNDASDMNYRMVFETNNNVVKAFRTGKIPEVEYVEGCDTLQEDEQPPLVYEHWNACPFECCVYREWVAKEPINIYQERDESSPIIATLANDESVNALTGVVVTKKVGRVIVLKQIKAFENSLTASAREIEIQKGAVVYPLHYEGEGYSVFWYEGKLYSGELLFWEKEKKVNIEQPFEYDWWAKIKKKNGKTGWTKQTNVFAQQDACG